ncbi:MAG: prolipoprotein diacylglyceryl transferase [Chloroflexi bacterium]|nr:prolipoprotein diacylglyceryl transferase [Chloroflexota bacterium]
MVPVISFGQLTLPTGPIVTLFAILLGLEVTGHYGRRVGLAPDDLWNTGLLAILAGLVVARLWNIIEFGDIYLSEPILILSIRPGGFVLWPGLIAAVVAAYLYLLRKALHPGRVAAAFTIGAIAAGILLAIGAFLTGSLLGMPSRWPWALSYWGEMRHPVALYQAVGLLLLLGLLWRWSDANRPGQTILLALLGYSLIRLVTDAFVAEATLWGNFRASQVVALVVALIIAWRLSRPNHPPKQPENREAA